MNDNRKTKAQLLDEIKSLRRRAKALEAIGIRRRQKDASPRRGAAETRAENRLLRAVFESSHGMIAFSLDAGYCYTFFTLAHHKTMKLIWDVDIEVGMNMLEAIQSADDRAKAKANFDRALRGENFTLEEEYGEGEQRSWWEDRYSPILGGDEKIIGLTVFVIDITKRKQAEESVRASEEKFRIAVQESLDGFVLVDIRGVIVEWNPANEQITGIMREAALGKFYWEIQYRLLAEEKRKPEALERYKSMIERAIQTGDAPFLNRIMEVEFTARDGRKHFVRQFVRAIHTPNGFWLAGTTHDFTERKKAEESLRESEGRFRSMFENHNAIMLLLEPGTGQILDANPAACQFYGYALEDFRRMKSQDVSTLAPEEIARRRQAAASGILKYSVADHRLAGGEMRTVEIHAAPIVSDNRPALFMIIHDITERKRAEESLRESENLLREIAANYPNSYVSIVEKDLTIGFTSGQEFKKLGLDSNQFTGLTVEQAFGGYAPLVRENYLKTFEGEETQFELFINAQYQNYRTAPLMGKDGKINRILAVVENITERKQAEEALRESEERFRSLFDNTTIGIYRTTPDGRILFSNPAGVRMLGYGSFAEMTSRNLEEDGFNPGYERDKFHQLMQRDGFVSGLESAWKRSDGSTIYVRESATAVKDQDGNILYYDGTFEDITQRKEAEEGYRLLFETMTQGIVYQDMEGRIISANPAAERILGLSLAQMQGRTSFDPRWHAIHEDGSAFPGETHPAMMALRSGEPAHDIMGVFHPRDGQYTWISINAIPLFRPGSDKPYQAYATFEDISERKRNEDILRARLRLTEFAEKHSVSELMRETLDEICALVFSPIGFYHFVDSDQETLALQSWSTRTWREFCSASGEGSHYPISKAGIWADCVREKRPIIHNDYAAVENKKGLPDGHAPLVRELVVPIIRGGKVYAVMGVGNKVEQYTATDLDVVTALADFSWDIIQHRRREHDIRDLNTSLERRVEERTRELREAHELLVRQEKLAVLGRVAGAMGHELRNPLGVISNAIYFLKMTQPDAGKKAREYFEMIENHVRVSNKIITELLEFSQSQPANPTRFTFEEAIRQTLERLTVPEAVKIRVELAAGLPDLYADFQQATQILGHLTVNACQAMPRGGELIISAHVGADEARIVVRDTGGGISPENMRKLFEPLFTTKPQGVGLGLGLAICKKLAEANGGSVEAQSEAGVGSMFTVHLPVYVVP